MTLLRNRYLIDPMGFRRRRPSELRLASKPGTLPTGHAGAVGPKPQTPAQPEPSGWN